MFIALFASDRYHIGSCARSSVCGPNSPLLIELVGAWDLGLVQTHANAPASSDSAAPGFERLGLSGLILGHVVVDELLMRIARGNVPRSTATVAPDGAAESTLTLGAAESAKTVAVFDLRGMGSGHLGAVCSELKRKSTAFSFLYSTSISKFFPLSNRIFVSIGSTTRVVRRYCKDRHQPLSQCHGTHRCGKRDIKTG